MSRSLTPSALAAAVKAPESEQLGKLRRGQIGLSEYLDYRADEAVAHLKGLVSSERLALIRATLLEQMTTDPVLVEQLRRITGLDLLNPRVP